MRYYFIMSNTILRDDLDIISLGLTTDRTYFTWLMNFSDYDLKELNYRYYMFSDLKEYVLAKPDCFISPEIDIPMWNFLKERHTFIKSNNNEDYGINRFELDENDLMYMKLMDWIE